MKSTAFYDASKITELLRLSTILIVFVQLLLVSTKLGILPRLSGVEGGEGSLCLLLSAEAITAF